MSTLKIPVGEQDHTQGPTAAPCTLVEYGDYECPHCRAAEPTVKRVQRHFGDRLRFVFRNFPLTKIHWHAEPAAEAAEFAANQGKFWEMHHAIFENQDRLGLDLFEELATELQLDPVALRSAVENEAFADHIRSDFAGGVRSGVNGTPTFFINGERHNGPFDYDHLVKAIEATLKA